MVIKSLDSGRMAVRRLDDRINHMTIPQDIVRQDKPAFPDTGQHRLIIIKILPLVGIDKDKVEKLSTRLSLYLRQSLVKRADVQNKLVGMHRA